MLAVAVGFLNCFRHLIECKGCGQPGLGNNSGNQSGSQEHTSLGLRFFWDHSFCFIGLDNVFGYSWTDHRYEGLRTSTSSGSGSRPPSNADYQGAILLGKSPLLYGKCLVSVLF